MSIKPIIILTALSIWSMALCAQQTETTFLAAKASDPQTVLWQRLASRTPIFPYQTFEEAVEDQRTNSDYVQILTDWKSERTANSTLYSSRYKVPFRWNDRIVLLRLQGVGSSFGVVVNGAQAGYSQPMGGEGCEFDLTKLSVENYNDLVIEVFDNSAADCLSTNNSLSSPTVRATILSQPKVRVRDLSVETSLNGNSGLLNLGVVMESHLLNPKNFTIYYQLLSPEGRTVAESRRDLNTQMLSKDTVYFFATVPEVLTWSHESPYLYTLIVKTQYEGRFKEFVPLKVGFRSLSYLAGKFAVNGKVVDMAATDDKSLQNGSYDSAIVALKEQGYNMIMATKQHPWEFYDSCDRNGMYLCDATDIDTSRSGTDISKGGNPSNDPAWTAAYIERAIDMYHSSKVHPSVVAFALANRSANGICLYESYLALKELEGKRPICYADAAGEWNNDAIIMSQPQRSTGKLIEAARNTRGSIKIDNLTEQTALRLRVTCNIIKGRSTKFTDTQEIVVSPQKSEIYTIPVEQIKQGDEKSYKAQIVIERIAIPHFYSTHNTTTTTRLKEMTLDMDI